MKRNSGFECEGIKMGFASTPNAKSINLAKAKEKEKEKSGSLTSLLISSPRLFFAKIRTQAEESGHGSPSSSPSASPTTPRRSLNGDVLSPRKLFSSFLSRKDQISFSPRKSNPQFSVSEGRTLLMGGTLDQVTEWILLHEEEVLFQESVALLLFGYRTYVTSEEFLSLLKNIYQNNKTPHVVVRLTNLLKQWLFDWGSDIDQGLLQQIVDFDVQIHSSDFHLLNLLECVGKHRQSPTFVLENSQGKEKDSQKRRALSTTILVNTPRGSNVQSSHKQGEELMKQSSKYIARQLTGILVEILRWTQQKEFVNNAWSKKDGESLSPHLFKAIRRSNELALWVGTMVLSGETSRDRASVISKFITIASHLYANSDFETLSNIIYGLESAAISRLTFDWRFVPSTHMQTFKLLRKFVNPKSNFGNYRKKTLKLSSPYLPILGVLSHDLTVLAETLEDYIDQRLKIVNFDKTRQMHKHIAMLLGNIKQFSQTVSEPLISQSLQKILWDLPHRSEEEQYSTSCHIQARQIPPASMSMSHLSSPRKSEVMTISPLSTPRT